MLKLILAAILFTGCAAAPVKREWRNMNRNERIALALQCMDDDTCQLPKGVVLTRK